MRLASLPKEGRTSQESSFLERTPKNTFGMQEAFGRHTSDGLLRLGNSFELFDQFGY